MSNVKVYNFTLILSHVDDTTPGLEDALFEANCDDALINFRNGTVFLDFDREGSDLESTIISAIKDVEGSSLNANVIGVGPDDFVSESEIAARLNIKRQAVSLWVKRQRRAGTGFPHPVLKLSERSPMWHWHEVVEWLYQQKKIQDAEIIKDAKCIGEMNLALSERNPKIRKKCNYLIQQLGEARAS
jgi:predicted DNA-binding transcriptional regulator AlpA